ncbi:hypothetical protein FRB91_005438, partial [Serendipita sp. 411]
FEKELEALRKELAQVSASRAATPAASTTSLPSDHRDSSSEEEGDSYSNGIQMQSTHPSAQEKKSQ